MIFQEGGGIIMSHNENGTKETRFSFLLTLFFTLLLTLGVIFSYVKSFLPDIEPVSFLPAAIISAAVFSFLFHLKRGAYFPAFSFNPRDLCHHHMENALSERRKHIFAPLCLIYERSRIDRNLFLFIFPGSFHYGVFDLFITDHICGHCL